jgi:hypothetical protein
MAKQNLLTILGIALSFIIAIGGWGLTSMLIDIKSDTLLSENGLTPVHAPAALSPTPPDPDDVRDVTGGDTLGERPLFSEVEIARILLNWETDGEEQLHEPIKGQLDMEQAIARGEDGLAYFYDQGVIPEELLAYEKTSAYLCQKRPGDGKSQALSPDYSYWVLSFTGKNGYLMLTLNAVTGQIWRLELKSNLTATVVKEIKTVEQILDVFIGYVGLTGSGKYMVDGEAAFKSFADGRLYAIAQSNLILDSNRYGMIMYLSVRRGT